MHVTFYTYISHIRDAQAYKHYTQPLHTCTTYIDFEHALYTLPLLVCLLGFDPVASAGTVEQILCCMSFWVLALFVCACCSVPHVYHIGCKADLRALLQDDGLTYEDMGTLLDLFPQQPLDFFGSLRSSVYDDQIRAWIQDDVLKNNITDEDANLTEVSQRLVDK